MPLSCSWCCPSRYHPRVTAGVHTTSRLSSPVSERRVETLRCVGILTRRQVVQCSSISGGAWRSGWPGRDAPGRTPGEGSASSQGPSGSAERLGRPHPFPRLHRCGFVTLGVAGLSFDQGAGHEGDRGVDARRMETNEVVEVVPGDHGVLELAQLGLQLLEPVREPLGALAEDR